jgi:hypothetical protein
VHIFCNPTTNGQIWNLAHPPPTTPHPKKKKKKKKKKAAAAGTRGNIFHQIQIIACIVTDIGLITIAMGRGPSLDWETVCCEDKKLIAFENVKYT